jgi:hypothetical protein
MEAKYKVKGPQDLWWLVYSEDDSTIYYSMTEEGAHKLCNDLNSIPSLRADIAKLNDDNNTILQSMVKVVNERDDLVVRFTKAHASLASLLGMFKI